MEFDFKVKSIVDLLKGIIWIMMLQHPLQSLLISGFQLILDSITFRKNLSTIGSIGLATKTIANLSI